jgi:hypothetical protein
MLVPPTYQPTIPRRDAYLGVFIVVISFISNNSTLSIVFLPKELRIL